MLIVRCFITRVRESGEEEPYRRIRVLDGRDVRHARAQSLEEIHYFLGCLPHLTRQLGRIVLFVIIIKLKIAYDSRRSRIFGGAEGIPPDLKKISLGPHLVIQISAPNAMEIWPRGIWIVLRIVHPDYAIEKNPGPNSFLSYFLPV